MKYKVGDKVRVRSDLVANGDYGGWRFEAEMIDKKGMILTVDSIDSDDYYIMDDESEYWTDEMLEDVEEEFKLPEKWCIKQCSDLKEWGKTTTNRPDKDFDSDRWYYWPVNESLRYWDFGGKGAREEITFDQFKKYVLKESESTPVKDNKIVWLNGRWYRILNNWWGKFETIHNSGKRIKFSESITSSGKYDATPKNMDLISEIEPLTDLSEIQQYLPENHPDKIKMRTKKVEDLKYPDVVHCSSKKEHDKVKQFVSIGSYEGNCYYLLGAKSWRKEPWIGTCASNPESRTTYTNYEFSDIIFPEEKVVNKEWSSSGYVVLLNHYMGIAKGTISRINHDYGHGVTISHAIDNGDPANLTKDSECRWFPTLEEAQAFSDELLGENKVETKPMLSKEELLAEAKRRYPVGTKYKCANGISAPGNEECFEITHGDKLKFFDDSRQKIDAYGRGFVYYEGKWAEIISKQAVEKEVERLSFYVKYNTSFTEDLYNKLMEWCVKNNTRGIRGHEDSYTGLVEHGYFIYDNFGVNNGSKSGYGVDNNRQNCINEYSIQQVKELIGYKEVLEHPKEELVQTGLSQQESCRSCSYYKIVRRTSKRCYKQDSCNATGGQHYPKDNSSERYTVTLDPFDAESSSDGIETGKFPLDRGMGFYEQMAKLHMQGYYPTRPIRDLYKTPVEPKDCLDSDEIYVPIIKTEVKQIKL